MPLIRLLIFGTILCSCFYAFGQFATVYFYVWEFQDFVNSEVRSIPTRDVVPEVHLITQIVDMARYCKIELDPKQIRIRKKVTIPGMTWTTLAVDVTYSAPVDLHVYRQPLYFHTTASVVY
jgi:hypothetical protein